MDMELLKASFSLSKRGRRGCVIAFVISQVWNILIGIYHITLGVYSANVTLGFVVMGFMAAYAVGLLLTPLGRQSDWDEDD